MFVFNQYYNIDFLYVVTPPAERVHFILGEDEDGTHESHPLFSEMEELHYEGDEMEWRETARSVKLFHSYVYMYF